MIETILSQYLLKKVKVGADGKIEKTVSNYASTVFLDKIWNSAFVDSFGKSLLKQFIKDADKQFTLTSSYFAAISPKHTKAIQSEIRESLFLSMGYDVNKKKLHPQGLLSQVVTDKSAINKVKNIVHQAVATGQPLSGLQSTLKVTIIGNGLLKGFFQERVPDPYDRFDRQASKEFAQKLDMQYVVYQGGTIDTSRPFCIERNGQVFTVDEVERFGTPNDKFGGYTNKSNGEFQGKTKTYEPFSDLGGYNCRHHLDYITEELAFQLRPELADQKNRQ